MFALAEKGVGVLRLMAKSSKTKGAGLDALGGKAGWVAEPRRPPPRDWRPLAAVSPAGGSGGNWAAAMTMMPLRMGAVARAGEGRKVRAMRGRRMVGRGMVEVVLDEGRDVGGERGL